MTNKLLVTLTQLLIYALAKIDSTVLLDAEINFKRSLCRALWFVSHLSEEPMNCPVSFFSRMTYSNEPHHHYSCKFEFAPELERPPPIIARFFDARNSIFWRVQTSCMTILLVTLFGTNHLFALANWAFSFESIICAKKFKAWLNLLLLELFFDQANRF